VAPCSWLSLAAEVIEHKGVTPAAALLIGLRVLVRSDVSEPNRPEDAATLSENAVATQSRVRIPLGPPFETVPKLSLLLRIRVDFAHRLLIPETGHKRTEADTNGQRRGTEMAPGIAASSK